MRWTRLWRLDRLDAEDAAQERRGEVRAVREEEHHHLVQKGRHACSIAQARMHEPIFLHHRRIGPSLPLSAPAWELRGGAVLEASPGAVGDRSHTGETVVSIGHDRAVPLLCGAFSRKNASTGSPTGSCASRSSGR
jgi:hypothetical protein